MVLAAAKDKRLNGDSTNKPNLFEALCKNSGKKGLVFIHIASLMLYYMESFDFGTAVIKCYGI